MSRHRHTYLYSFEPSTYSKGLQPLPPYNIHETEQMAGYAYGGPVDLALKVYDWTQVDEEKPPSLLAQYWWMFLLAAPFVYVGVNMALDSAKSPQEKK